MRPSSTSPGGSISTWGRSPPGCPTDGVKAPEEEEPKWKGLSRLEQLRLLGAAQALRARRGRGTAQGLRDHGLIAALLGTGLRAASSSPSMSPNITIAGL
ncbi:MAG TPA: hypothetical protein VLK82_20880 [Candidatus Tectomicrobia bacterium]|nr:hypothetical protein [Candidatus Tectomicrobia bacterium]